MEIFNHTSFLAFIFISIMLCLSLMLPIEFKSDEDKN